MLIKKMTDQDRPKKIKTIIRQSLKYPHMTQAVYFSVTRLSSLIRINFFKIFQAGKVEEREVVFKACRGGHAVDCGAWHPAV